MVRDICVTLLAAMLAMAGAFAQLPQLSVPHGIYTEDFRLLITSPDPEGEVYYTLDGTDPRQNGMFYGGSLGITGTVVVKAALRFPGDFWSEVVTASYIFPRSLLHQPNRPTGYPYYWGKYCQIEGQAIADYEMDREITSNATYAKYVTDGILTLPIVSLSTAPQHLFGPEPDEATGGIYIFTGCPVGNAVGRGWERPVTFEMIGGAEAHDLTVDCCIKLHGGHGRLPEKNPKHAFRLHFKSDYGPKKLKYRVFGDRGPESFNAIVLRTFFGYSWQHWDNTQRNRAQYTRDLWARATQLHMGDPISIGQYVHLFINGLYWGIYNQCERVTDDFCSQHFGGNKEDWDVTEVDGGEGNIHAAIADYGSIDAWNKMADLIYALPDHSSYMHLIGCGSDGKPNVKYPPMLDTENFIRYMLINLYGGNTDWDHHNWYAYRNRVTPQHGFRFICWDSETVIVSATENITSKNNRGCPTGFLNRLMKQGLFAHRFHEEAQRALTHGGPLTPEGAQTTWDSLYHVIETALWDESARWGDYRRDVHPYSSKGSLYRPDNYFATERRRILEQYFPKRTDTVIQQLRQKGWFPHAEAPAIFADGVELGYGVQSFSSESTLTMSGQNIYYTLDGSAPVSWFRNDAGALSMTAKPYDDGEDILAAFAHQAMPDTITLKAISYVNGEWSPIVTTRLAVYQPDYVSAPKTEAPATSGLFDLHGRRLLTSKTLQQGIYIINGKKVLR